MQRAEAHKRVASCHAAAGAAVATPVTAQITIPSICCCSQRAAAATTDAIKAVKACDVGDALVVDQGGMCIQGTPSEAALSLGAHSPWRQHTIRVELLLADQCCYFLSGQCRSNKPCTAHAQLPGCAHSRGSLPRCRNKDDSTNKQ